MPGIDETENFFRVRLRDPDQFTRLRQIPFKRSKPRIFAIVGRLRGEATTTLQSLLFPKEDGWNRDSVSAWMREHPDVGKEFAVSETTQKRLLDEGVEPWTDDEVGALWEALAKGIPTGDVVRKTYAVETKQVYEEDNEVDIVISTSAIDRDREVVRPEGMRIMKPKRIPLVAAHHYSDLRKHIGELKRIKPEGEEIPARARYFAGMGNAEADWGWTLVKLEVAAYSIGFRPIKHEDADLDDEKVLEQVRAGKKPLRTFTEWELVEVSHVIVPSQREAVQREVAEAVTKGVIDQSFAERISRALEEDAARASAALKADDFLKAVLGEEAVEDSAVFYALEPKQGERWVVSGARGLPVLDDDAWDAPAAVAAWRRFTGATSAEGMKDRAVQRRYRRGFILTNASAPENLGSYKFPFVKVDGGRAKASRRGLIAARVVLAGGRNRPDAPAPTLSAAERLVNGYLGKPEGDGKAAMVIPRVAEVSLAAIAEAETDVVLVLDEDGGVLFRGAPTELSDVLEQAVGRPAEVHQHLTLTVKPIEIEPEALEAWAERFTHLFTSKLKAAIAEAAPKAPAIPADSVASLTRKELAETIVDTALKIARAEIGKAAGDVDAYR